MHKHHLPLTRAEQWDRAEGKEIRRKLPEFPDRWVTESGEVLRWVRHKKEWVPLNPWNGTYKLTSWRGSRNRRKTCVLVASAFLVPQPSESYYVAYLDGDEKNVHYSNLYWRSRSDLARDTVAAGRHNQAAKTRCKWDHELAQDNVYVYADKSRDCQTCRRAREKLTQFRKTAKRAGKPWEHMTMDWIMGVE